jgi:glycopeptide antibiotics resistance protein
MFLKYNIWGILWALIILVACATPGEQLPPSPFLDFDKLVHLAIFGVFQLLLLRGFLRQQNFPILQKNHVIISLMMSVGYGLLMEVLQGYVFRNRSFDVFDAAANTLGIILSTLVWILFLKKKIQL